MVGPNSPAGNEPEPLRERLPIYAKWLFVELGAAALISLIVWWLTDMSWPQALGASLIGIGVLSLLAGGLSGGGYSSAGSYGVLFGRRHDRGWDSTSSEIDRAQDLRTRLRDNLRPRRNPTAFWQVLGGLLLIGAGVVVLSLAQS